jgi:TolA-binding protein
MKLTKRQRKIILISALLFFLVLTTAASIVLITSKSQKPSSPVPSKNNLPSDKLTKTKTEIITSLEKKLSAENVKIEKLLQELKDKNYLNAGESN